MAYYCIESKHIFVKNRIETLFLLSQRESFVTVNIFVSKILMNFNIFEVPESE